MIVEPDRAAAIAAAVDLAAAGDVVVVAGKGHETTQTIGDAVRAVRRPRGRAPRAGGAVVITGRDGVSP